jgi:hypothetical protein
MPQIFKSKKLTKKYNHLKNKSKTKGKRTNKSKNKTKSKTKGKSKGKRKNKGKNKTMKGGAKMIFGFINIMEFLDEFDPSSGFTDSSKPRIIEFVDCHGFGKSVMYRWYQTDNSLVQNTKQQMVTDAFGTENYDDFDNFKKKVISSLKDVEHKIKEANAGIISNTGDVYQGLSMLTEYQTNEGSCYPYYLITKTSINDLTVMK